LTLTRDAVLPDPLQNGAFCSSVASEAIMHMRMDIPELDDPEAVRHKLLFACGSLYDFRDGTFRFGQRADRIARHLPWKFVEPQWPDAAKELVNGPNGLAELLLKLHRAKVPSLVEAARGETVLEAFCKADASRAIDLFHELAKHDEFTKFLLEWTLDVDEALLWLKWLTRGASSHPRFTEAIWLVGAAQGGKDVVVALIQAFGGTGSDGIVAELKWKYVTSKECGGTESCAPFLRACAAARYIIVSEVPNKPISMSLLKPLCEQRGARIAARTLYEGNHGFRPMALPLLTSNFTPKLNEDEADDSGAKTRIRVYSTTAVYTMQQTLPTHKQANVVLADEVNQGAFNASLFAIMRIVYRLLEHSPETRNVGPLPKRIREETEACFAGHSCSQLFQDWVATRVEQATVETASTTAEVYASAVRYLGSSSPQTTMVRAWLTSSGFYQGNETRTATKRYYTKRFSDQNGAVVTAPVRVVEEPPSQ